MASKLRIPSELTHRFGANGGVVLFAGAGLGRTAVSLADEDDPMPLAADLAKRLAKKLSSPRKAYRNNLSLNEVAEYYVNEGHARKDLLNWLTDELKDEQRKLPDEVGLGLRSIPFRAFVTTNYDTLLEKALAADPAAGRGSPVVWTTEGDVRPPTSETVYKLCGSIDKAEESILITQLEFDRDFGRKNVGVVERVKQLFNESTLLFVGYSLTDVPFRTAWAESLQRFGPNAQRAYAVLKGADKHVERYWNERQVTVINAGADVFLRKLMLKLDPMLDVNVVIRRLANSTETSEKEVRKDLQKRLQAGGYRSLREVALSAYRLVEESRV